MLDDTNTYLRSVNLEFEGDVFDVIITKSKLTNNCRLSIQDNNIWRDIDTDNKIEFQLHAKLKEEYNL